MILEKHHTEAVALYGLGDIGQRYALQCARAGLPVRAYDPNPTRFGGWDDVDPVDRALTKPINGHQAKVRQYQNPQDPHMLAPRFAHFLARSAFLDTYTETEEGRITVLHDSVADQSLEALAGRQGQFPRESGRFVVAHCLTNKHRAVLVATSSSGPIRSVPGRYFSHASKVSEHFERVGLQPVEMSVEEIDEIGAETQSKMGAWTLKYMFPMRRLEQIGSIQKRDALGRIKAKFESRMAPGAWNSSVVQSLVSNPNLESTDLIGVNASLFTAMLAKDSEEYPYVPESAEELQIPGVTTDSELYDFVDDLRAYNAENQIDIIKEYGQKLLTPSTYDLLNVLKIIQDG